METKIKKETNQQITDENIRLEIEIKREELKNKLAQLKRKGILVILVDDQDSPKKGNTPSFFGSLFKK